MFKRLLIAGAIVGGVAFYVRRKLSRGYDEDEIDSSDWGDFGDRPANAPEQRDSQAETRHDVSVEQLSEAARIETSMTDIINAWPSLSEADVKSAENDRERLASLIVEKTGQPLDEVRARLDGIIAQDTPRPSYPAL
jgi:hypothetical protein